MDWKDVRLSFDVPAGWARLDDVNPLTFQAASGLELRLTPLRVPATVEGGQDAKPLLGWALGEVARSLGEGAGTRIFPCRFGLCASQSVGAGGLGRVQLFLLASAYHVLMVSLHGAASRDDVDAVMRWVQSMHLVPATQYPN